MGKAKREEIKSVASQLSALCSIRLKPGKVWQASLIALFSCSFLTSAWILPAVSAERIAFGYGILGEFYISIADLEAFAKEGKITPGFAYYADRFSREDLAKLKNLLNRSFKISVVTTSTFLNLPIGKQLLREIGLIIDSPERVSQPALRASLILAAAEPDGLTILSVLRHYSTKTLKLNTDRIFEAANEATKLLTDTEQVFQTLGQEAKNRVATDNSLDLNTFADLSNSGSKKWRKEYLTVKSDSDRQIEGVVYLPISTDKPAPVIVVAPGLNTNWQNFTYIAEHLASYGFGVAAVNFPGTNARRVNAVLNGLDTPPKDNQWIEQPKIVTRLLDEMERKSQNEESWRGKLDLQRVGIIGQSLGGYTAMAIAGAKVDWQHLQKECRKIGSPERIDLNPALFWQCQSAANSSPNTDLRDRRIVAAIAINPVANPVFSQSGMSQFDSPLLIVAGDKDIFAPALDEQLVPFTWLPKNNKYLVLVKNSTHFSFIDEGDSDEFELPVNITGFNPALARSYLKVVSVAFFKTHLAQQNEFKFYLTESYIKRLSKPPLTINLLRSLNASQLNKLTEK